MACVAGESTQLSIENCVIRTVVYLLQFFCYTIISCLSLLIFEMDINLSFNYFLVSSSPTQREINTRVEEVQQTCTFGDFVSACERLMTQTKDQMNELEAHLEKYGYIRPKGIKNYLHCSTMGGEG